MTSVSDTRTDRRKAADERLASEPPLSPPDLPAGTVPRPVESFVRSRRPVAVMGVVENGLVRPLDSTVTLPEQLRVIIVAANGV